MKVLLSEDHLRRGVTKIAAQINQRYEDRPLTVVGVMTGSIVLLADLIRQLNMPLKVGLLQARSYRGAATTPGEVNVNEAFFPEIAGRDVLLVDDIFDTGRTLYRLLGDILEQQPKTLATAVLLRKQDQQQVDIQPDFIGFDIPNEFVVGYGLDYNDLYRNLPYLAALEPGDLEGSPA